MRLAAGRQTGVPSQDLDAAAKERPHFVVDRALHGAAEGHRDHHSRDANAHPYQRQHRTQPVPDECLNRSAQRLARTPCSLSPSRWLACEPGSAGRIVASRRRVGRVRRNGRGFTAAVRNEAAVGYLDDALRARSQPARVVGDNDDGVSLPVQCLQHLQQVRARL